MKDITIKNNFDKLDEMSDLTNEDESLLNDFENAFELIGNMIEKVELKSSLQEAMKYVSKVNS